MAKTVEILKKEIRYYTDDSVVEQIASDYSAADITISEEKISATFENEFDAHAFEVKLKWLWPYT